MRESYLSQLGKENETLDLVLLHGQVSEDEFEKIKKGFNFIFQNTVL